MSETTKPYLCSYFHDHAHWSLTIHAYDINDARSRCLKLGLNLDGELIATIPAKIGFTAKIVCVIRNSLRVFKRKARNE